MGSQRQDADVAVTKHGINHSPVLKKAHIGVAMRYTGSDAVKNVSTQSY